MSSMTHVYNSQEVILKIICNVSSVCLSLRGSFMCCAAVELQSTGYRKLPLALPNRNVKLHKGNKSFFPTQQHTQNLSTKKKKKKDLRQSNLWVILLSVKRLVKSIR